MKKQYVEYTYQETDGVRAREVKVKVRVLSATQDLLGRITKIDVRPIISGVQNQSHDSTIGDPFVIYVNEDQKTAIACGLDVNIILPFLEEEVTEEEAAYYLQKEIRLPFEKGNVVFEDGMYVIKQIINPVKFPERWMGRRVRHEYIIREITHEMLIEKEMWRKEKREKENSEV